MAKKLHSPAKQYRMFLEHLEDRIAPANAAVVQLAALDGDNGFRLEGVAAESSGYSVSSAGDVNGDGFADVIIGSPAGGLNSGSAFVVYGHGEGFTNPIDLTALNGDDGYQITGGALGDQVGFSVSRAGDVNNDGLDDLIVGAFDVGASTGATYVVFGSESGFGPSLDVTTLDGTDGFLIQGAPAGSESGRSVSGAGDVNGDGFADLIIGAPVADPGAMADAGSAYIVFGAASFGATVNLATLNGTDGFRLDGASAGDLTGIAVSGAGDVNGDGYADVIIGAVGAAPNGSFSGSSYVVFGASDWSATPVVALSTLNGTTGFRLEGVAAMTQSGSAVSSAGDLNSDGFDDLIIGARGAAPNGTDSGSSYVVFGKADWSGSATLGLSTLTGANGFRLDGVSASDKSGWSVSGAGDVNADGFDDLIIGAPFTFGDASGSGAAYVVYGKAAGFTSTQELDDLNGDNGFAIVGDEANANAGISVSGAGDVNGDGFADLVIGGPTSSVSYVLFGTPTTVDATIAADGKSATYTDEHGDLVTVKVSKGALTQNNFILQQSGVGATLNTLNLDNIQFAGANVTISAKPIAGNGDGLANIGFFNASGIDLGTVSIKGDLGRIDAGDVTYTTAAVKTLSVVSMGAAPKAIAVSASSTLLGGAGKISASSDIKNVALFAGGNGAIIGTLAVKGSLEGAFISIQGADTPVSASKAVALKTLTVGGSVISSQIIAGAELNADVQIGKVSVKGNWVTSSLVAGAVQGSSGQWGRLSNALAPNDTVAIPSKIGGVTIKGMVSGSGYSGNSFGFVAEQVGSLKVGKGSAVVGDMTRLTGDGEVRLRLIGGSTVAPVVSPVQTSSDASVIALSSLDGTNGFSLNGVAATNQSGYSVRSAGDVNGDGFDDVIIGAPRTSPNGTYSGSSYVVFGSNSGFGASFNLATLDGTNGFRLDGEAMGDKSGWFVSGAGDVNGDGFDDVIVGAPYADPDAGTNNGASYVVFGNYSGFTATLALGSLDGTNGFRMNGVVNGNNSGWSVGGAGDVNGDGFDDVIIGAPNAYGPGLFAGRSYVVFGTDAGFAATLDLSSLNGINGFFILGAAASSASGTSVSGAGDVNGDGFGDVIIGAPNATTDSGNSGAGYVVFGKSDWSSTPSFQLSTLNGADGFRIAGVVANDQSGRSVSGAGDVNGDGFADVILGAPYADPNGTDNGLSYVVFGKSSGFGANLALSSLNGNNGFRIDGVATNDQSGKSVSGAGDINGDGFADVIIGAQYASQIVTNAGASYVLFGKAGGFGATFGLSGLNGANGFRLDGTNNNDTAGFAVSGAGDFNGDGFADLIIGAPSGDPNGSNSGESYIFFGETTTINATIAANGKSATYTDENGDLVTVKVGAGVLTQGNFTLRKFGLGAKLDGLDLTTGGFEGASVTVSAKATKGLGGDGLANVGVVSAGGVNLGAVKIAGDIGAIQSGTGSTTVQAVKSLAVHSIGIDPYAPSFSSTLNGYAGKISITTDVRFAGLTATKFDTITAKGALTGALISASGEATPASNTLAVVLKSLKVTGSVNFSTILAGNETNAQTQIGKVEVGGNWTASNLVAGAVTGPGNQWGLQGNVQAGNGGPIASKIASIVIKGGLFGSIDPSEHFGFVAQEFGSVKIGGGTVSIVDNAQLAPATGDVTLRLV